MVKTTFRYIPCRVEPGMFRGEYLAFLDILDPQNPSTTVQAQALVDEATVSGIRGVPRRNNPVTGWLQVEVIDSVRGAVRVALPQPAQPVGGVALVPESQVQEFPT